MGNAQLQQKLWFCIREQRRVHEEMMSIVRSENQADRRGGPQVSGAQVWNELQAEHAQLGQDIREIEILLDRYNSTD